MVSKFEERAYFSKKTHIGKRRKIIPARIQLQPRIILNRINSTPHPSNSKTCLRRSWLQHFVWYVIGQT